MTEKTKEIFEIPERGSDGTETGRTIVYRRGELGERWNLIKAAADTPEQKQNLLDIELRSLKREQVKFNKDKQQFTDGSGKVYSGKDINDQNNLVSLQAKKLVREHGYGDEKYVNKFMFTKGWDWKRDEWAHGDEDEKLDLNKKNNSTQKILQTPIEQKPISYDPLIDAELAILRHSIKQQTPGIEKIYEDTNNKKNLGLSELFTREKLKEGQILKQLGLDKLKYQKEERADQQEEEYDR
jgi:hypothetical protein